MLTPTLTIYVQINCKSNTLKRGVNIKYYETLKNNFCKLTFENQSFSCASNIVSFIMLKIQHYLTLIGRKKNSIKTLCCLIFCKINYKPSEKNENKGPTFLLKEKTDKKQNKTRPGVDFIKFCS